MQEIIPFLVGTWKELDSEHTEIVDVDETSMKSYFKAMMTADQIILTCFTPSLYRAAAFIRSEVNNSAQFIIHLHNQATIGCWPLRHWGGKELFRESDVFVSSCQRDAACLKISYPEATVKVVPFSYKSLPREISNLKKSRTIPFIFFGRMSSQKNLHSLLLSFHHLSVENPEIDWTFDFFGNEDGLGSPNMSRQDQGYEIFLKDLVKKLKLDHRIRFNGFQDRGTIQKWLNEKKSIFVAPSLHSDENFGMAAFQSLIGGHLAVLSDWGGHSDFKKYFSKQVYLCPIYKTPAGPFLNPAEFKSHLVQAVTDYVQDISDLMPTNYLFESILQQNKNILKFKSQKQSLLQSSEAADLILSKIPKNPSKLDQGIFESYEDPLAHLFLSTYGMENQIPDASARRFFVPWLFADNSKTIVQDPHRGSFEFGPLSSEKANEDLALRGFSYS